MPSEERHDSDALWRNTDTAIAKCDFCIICDFRQSLVTHITLILAKIFLKYLYPVKGQQNHLDLM